MSTVPDRGPWTTVFVIAFILLGACRQASTDPAGGTGAASENLKPPTPLPTSWPSLDAHRLEDRVSPEGGPLVAAIAPPYRTFSEHHRGGLLSIAFVPPDGLRALTSGVDNMARLWDATTGHVLKRFAGEAFSFQSLAFDQSGHHVLTAGDPSASYWELDTGNIVKTLPAQPDGVRVVALSPNGHGGATVGGGDLVLWDLDAGTEVRRVQGVGWTLALAYSPDGGQVLWVGDDGRFCRMDTKGARPPQCIELPVTQLDTACLSDSQWVTGDREGVLTMWDLGGHKIRRWPAHEPILRGGVVSLAFEPKKSLAVSSGPDHALRAWNTTTGAKLGEIAPLPTDFSIAAIAPDGRRVLFTTDDGGIHLWSLAGR